MKSQAQVEGGIGRSTIEENEWQLFSDPETDPEFFTHMSEPIPVQFLGENWEKGPWIIPNKFAPNCKADAHAHNYDTIYYIIEGTMTFNDGTGWYKKGDLRWARKNVMYGPEEAGPEGCTFLLISGGPMDVQWKNADVHVVKG